MKGGYAFRAIQLSSAFLHSLTHAANESGSRMISVTMAAMLKGVACMMFLFGQVILKAPV
jgi:hypothetical protein